VDVKVLDHFIIAGTDALSFAERGLLQGLRLKTHDSGSFLIGARGSQSPLPCARIKEVNAPTNRWKLALSFYVRLLELL
jgi:hypothetical protein